jgi:hypothetical protein
MDKFTSGEDPRARQLTKVAPKDKKSLQWWIIAVAAVALIGISFGALHYVQHSDDPNVIHKPLSKQSPADDTPSSKDGPRVSATCEGADGGPCSGGPRDGTVTAVSATSITIQAASGNDTRTLSITSATQEMKGTQASAFNLGDVHVGDRVSVIPSSTDSSQAQTIMLGGEGDN